MIAVEDNKPEAIQAIQQSLHGANDIELRVIPTKYPSGAAKQLIYLLTGNGSAKWRTFLRYWRINA